MLAEGADFDSLMKDWVLIGVVPTVNVKVLL